MLPNNISSIGDIINAAEHPVLILVVADECENKPTSHEMELEQALQQHTLPVVYYKWCIPENAMIFPRTQAPMLYFFLPKNQQVAFWRNINFMASLNEDIEMIHKMTTGLTYEEVRYTEQEREKIREVESFLQQESEEIKKYPSAFQMARNLAKDVWNTGKKAAKGLPVIVSAEVGYHRLQTCEGCDKFEQETSRCRECGCFMKVKTQLASASCPLGKWDAIV